MNATTDRRRFLSGLGLLAATWPTMASPIEALKPADNGPLGLKIDQYFRLPKSHQQLVADWVIANGVKLEECRHVWFYPGGDAHFNLITTDGRGKLVLQDGEIAEYWLCIPDPTPPPAVAWLPWEGIA